jgi:hypothetical protein
MKSRGLYDWNPSLYPDNRIELIGENKSAPPHNFSILKGWNYIAASHLFVDYILNSEYGKILIAWAEDSWIPVCSIIVMYS